MGELRCPFSIFFFLFTNCMKLVQALCTHFWALSCDFNEKKTKSETLIFTYYYLFLMPISVIMFSSTIKTKNNNELNNLLYVYFCHILGHIKIMHVNYTVAYAWIWNRRMFIVYVYVQRQPTLRSLQNRLNLGHREI